MREFVPANKGPAVITGAKSSNTISDEYRNAITISYQYINSDEADTTFEFCGKKLSSPIMCGPIGGLNKVMDHGVVNYAKGIEEANSMYWTDYHERDAWEEILSHGYPALRVIKPLADLGRLKEEIRHDEEKGAPAFAMDVDHGITPYGKRDGQKEAFAPKTEADLKELAGCTSLPFYLKGIISVHDAEAAMEAGARGIVVSGHNNRFPCMVPPLKMLPEIRAAVGDRLEIYVDGGFNNGYDVFKALALGADGVLIARAGLAAFAKGQSEGIADLLLEMSAQLKGAMANTGSRDLKHINRDAVILP